MLVEQLERYATARYQAQLTSRALGSKVDVTYPGDAIEMFDVWLRSEIPVMSDADIADAEWRDLMFGGAR